MILPSILEDLGLILFPDYCRSCGIALFRQEELICIRCLRKLPRSGFVNIPDNPVEKIFWGRIKLETAFSFVHFSKKGMVQHLLHQLKYQDCPALGRRLGELFAADIKRSGRAVDPDVIVPVPLHPRKKHKRGYNQSQMIAEGLSEGLSIPVVSCLKRVDDGESQTRKSKFDRWRNVDMSFELDLREPLDGRHILLVDDVITTGATIEACGRHLLSIPNARLSVAGIAFPMN